MIFYRKYNASTPVYIRFFTISDMVNIVISYHVRTYLLYLVIFELSVTIAIVYYDYKDDLMGVNTISFLDILYWDFFIQLYLLSVSEEGKTSSSDQLHSFKFRIKKLKY